MGDLTIVSPISKHSPGKSCCLQSRSLRPESPHGLYSEKKCCIAVGEKYRFSLASCKPKIGHSRLAISCGIGASFGSEKDKTKKDGKFVDETRKSFIPADEAESGTNDSGQDMMKLFNDAQKNMLFINKQRALAVEELRKSEVEKEILQARVSQLEAEREAALAQQELLSQQLKTSAGSGLFAREEASIWSSLLLQVDSMRLSGAITEMQARDLRSLALARDHTAGESFLKAKSSHDNSAMAAVLLPLLNRSSRPSLHIVHLCTELFPATQVGSLGTWVAGLGSAVGKKGHIVEVILPKHSLIDRRQVEDLTEAGLTFQSFFDGQWRTNTISTGLVQGLPVTFIEPREYSSYFSRDSLYGYEDDFERFSYFSRACLDYLKAVGKSPDVLHLHDWHTALVAPLFWEQFSEQMGNTRLLLTCHNFKYQMLVDPWKLALCGLDPARVYRLDRLQDNRDLTKANPLKGGIVYSNKVTTVSPVYASDVKQKGLGLAFGLEATLATHESKFAGLPSGLPSTLHGAAWSPASDPHLPLRFSVETVWQGKQAARESLTEALGLPASVGDQRPLVVCMVRNAQEGDLEGIQSAMNVAVSSGAQFVCVAASISARVQAQLEDIQRGVTDENAEVVISVEEEMLHLAMAAADILLCLEAPSATSWQLPVLALQYGSLPVFRQPGDVGNGLVDYDDGRKGRSEGSGFIFAAGKEMPHSLKRAIGGRVRDPAGWAAVVIRAMQTDVSWGGQSCEAYIEAYTAAVNCK